MANDLENTAIMPADAGDDAEAARHGLSVEDYMSWLDPPPLEMGPLIDARPIDDAEHYWLCAERPDEVFSTRASEWVDPKVEEYVTWISGGRMPSRIGTLAELAHVLHRRGHLPPTVLAVEATDLSGLPDDHEVASLRTTLWGSGKDGDRG